MTNDLSRSDIYTRITQTIIAAIEAGAEKYEMPWQKADMAGIHPVNVATNKPYRGVNTLVLWATGQDQGFSSPVWATYKQWQEVGAQVRKGEKSAPVVFWKMDELDSDDGDETNNRRRMIARGYSVFNAAQVDGWNGPVVELPPRLSDADRIAHAEAFFTQLGAKITEGGSRAFYRPSTDEIRMPPFRDFIEPKAFYAVLAHECTHWTGDKSRCNRDLSGRFGSESYAAEELVAELGAAFLCADLGLSNEPRPDHASYVASWLKVLKADNRAIFAAASLAQRAVDWMHLQQSSLLERAA